MQSEHFRVNCELEKLSEIFSTWQLLQGGIYLFILLYILLALIERIDEQQCFEPLRFLALIINRLDLFFSAHSFIFCSNAHIYIYLYLNVMLYAIQFIVTN